jgi:lipid-A-disaccharide synthase
VALLPGSRKSEVNFLLPEMLRAMELLKKEFNITLLLQKAGGIDRELIDRYLNESPLSVQIIPQDRGYDLINAADIVLTTCGTSNLEIAVIGTPFTSVYRVNKLSYFLGKGFVKIDLYSIVNILARKEVIKELIQRDFTAENIVKEMRNILSNPDVRANMLAEFDRLRHMLTQDKNAPEIIYKKITEDVVQGVKVRKRGSGLKESRGNFNANGDE